MEICVKISQLFILLFTPKTTTIKTLKSNLAIKSNLSFYLVYIEFFSIYVIILKKIDGKIKFL